MRGPRKSIWSSRSLIAATFAGAMVMTFESLRRVCSKLAKKKVVSRAIGPPIARAVLGLRQRVFARRERVSRVEALVAKKAIEPPAPVVRARLW